jgi:hypothetical protein
VSEGTTSADALRDLGAACLALYLHHTPANTLYERACRAGGDRASALLRRYLEPGGAELRTPIPPDDRDLFLVAGQDCLRLAAMAQGLAALEAEELRTIVKRPRSPAGSLGYGCAARWRPVPGRRAVPAPKGHHSPVLRCTSLRSTTTSARAAGAATSHSRQAGGGRHLVTSTVCAVTLNS